VFVYVVGHNYQTGCTISDDDMTIKLKTMLQLTNKAHLLTIFTYLHINTNETSNKIKSDI